MFNKWCRLALVAGWLGWVTTASAQYLPNGGPPPHMPEPVPIAASQAKSKKQIPPENLVPGPLGPDLAPLGPSDDLSLPENIPSAFSWNNYACHDNVFLHLGSRLLTRNRLGHATFAYADSTRRPAFAFIDTDNDAGEDLTQRDFFIDDLVVDLRDSGQAPPVPGNIFTVHDPNNIRPGMTTGATASIGYVGQSSSVELSGFYMPRNSERLVTFFPRGINAPFANAPTGFEGDNG